jgi:thioredoxin-like negative regulator of GroEL
MQLFRITFVLVTIFGVFLARLLAVDIDPSDFDKEVLQDERAWLVEFYSPMCGSCQEFTPVWEGLEGSMKSLVLGKVNIDIPEGAKLADKLGVLEQGIPNVQLFAGSMRETIMAGDLLSPKQISKKVRQHMNALTRRDDGFYLKQATAYLGA